MKRVLLTGASGFIGRHAIPFLIEKGYEVHAVYKDRNHGLKEENNLYWHKCNLLNSLEQEQLLAEVKPSHLLHLAWYAIPGKYWMSLENLKWVKASSEFIVNFVKQGGIRAVVAGTSAEYDWSTGYCSEKVTLLKPSSIYGTCKNNLHDTIQQISTKTGLSYAWGRVFYLYGPYEYPDRLVASVICSLIKDKNVTCHHGNLIRDFLHVQDAASAFVSILDSNVMGPVNIASGISVALMDVVNTIADKLNKRALVRFEVSPSTINEPGMLVADTKRLNSEVDWVPGYEIERGLEQTIDWWKTKGKIN